MGASESDRHWRSATSQGAIRGEHPDRAAADSSARGAKGRSGLGSRVPRSAVEVLKLQRLVGNTAVRMIVTNVDALADRRPVALSGDRTPSAVVVQRAMANVSYHAAGAVPITVAGQAVGKGGVGGVSHSEQKVWEQVQEKIKNLLKRGKSVSVTFEVDTPICTGCAPWFENTVYPDLQAAAATGGTTCALYVVVKGKSLAVTGSTTIWPPEIADAPTFDRLSMMDRSMRYLKENRDETGKVRAERNEYVDTQVNALDELFANYRRYGLTLDAIEHSMANARAYVVQMQRGRFDEDKAKETLDSYLQTKAFSKILGSGGVTLPTMSIRPDPREGVGAWFKELEKSLVGWMTTRVEGHFEDYENQDADSYSYG